MAAAATCRRVKLSGTVQIILPPEEALALFTPDGERRWAHGWDPQFPSPSDDSAEPGTVFQTENGAHKAIWTVVRHEAGKMISYAVVTPGERGGLVTVTCQSAAQGTQATVDYDLTALNTDANDDIDRFANNYAAFLSHWEQSISRVVAGQTQQGPH